MKFATPFILGSLGSAVLVGQLMSRLGRYKPLTVTGLVATTVGCYLLSTMGTGMSLLQTPVYMFITGTIGMTGPTLATAIQNAVSGDDTGEVRRSVSPLSGLSSTGDSLPNSVMHFRTMWIRASSHRARRRSTSSPHSSNSKSSARSSTPSTTSSSSVSLRSLSHSPCRTST